MLPFYVYILKCSDNSYYVGQTDNLEKRVFEHQSGQCDGYTFFRRPVELVYFETCCSRDDARAAEYKIKGWSRKKKEALINGDWQRLILLSNEKKNNNDSRINNILRQAQDERDGRNFISIDESHCPERSLQSRALTRDQDERDGSKNV